MEPLQAVRIYTYPDPKQAAAGAPLQVEWGQPVFWETIPPSRFGLKFCGAAGAGAVEQEDTFQQELEAYLDMMEEGAGRGTPQNTAVGTIGMRRMNAMPVLRDNPLFQTNFDFCDSLMAQFWFHDPWTPLNRKCSTCPSGLRIVPSRDFLFCAS